jgi:hypothetical protein
MSGRHWRSVLSVAVMQLRHAELTEPVGEPQDRRPAGGGMHG